VVDVQVPQLIVQQQLLSWTRASEVLADLAGVQISEGTLASLIERCSAQLAEVEEQIKEALVKANVLHQEETGLYVNGLRYWMHVACTAQLTHDAVHPKRGKAALDAIGILPRFAGTSVHDGWHSYFLYACSHALCLVHLLRELTFLAEEQQQEWAAELKTLLLDMKAAGEQARLAGQSVLHPLEVDDWEAQYTSLLAQVDELNPVAQAPAGKKGRPKERRIYGHHRAVRGQKTSRAHSSVVRKDWLGSPICGREELIHSTRFPTLPTTWGFSIQMLDIWREDLPRKRT